MDATNLARAQALADEGKTLRQVAAAMGVGLSTVQRAGIRTHGQGQRPRRAHKKDKHLDQVLALHAQGKTVEEIAGQVPVHVQTVAEWIRSEGLHPRYARITLTRAAAPDVKDHPLYARAIELHAAGKAEFAIASELGVSRYQARRFITASDDTDQGGRAARSRSKAQQACDLFREGKSLDEVQKTVRLDYYRLRLALDQAGLHSYPESERPPDKCPCGKRTGVPGQKYCSHEHRMQYGQKRQADPGNQVSFTCARPACGREVTVPKSYASAKKYCSNECSAKHNRTKQHIAIEDALVLDSPYEALLYGLLRLWKIPVERADREQAIEVNGSGWYCPDFWLPGLDLWVEVKGFEDQDDRDRCAAWRAAGHQLVVLSRIELHTLRALDDRAAAELQLRVWA